MPKRKKGPPKTRKKVKSKPIDWVAIKVRWLAENLNPTGNKYTFSQCARDFRVNADNLRKVAKAGDWVGELRNQEAKLADETISRTRKYYADIENECRARQADLGKKMQKVGKARIDKIDTPENLSVKDAIEFSRHGAELERKARGLPERIDIHANVEVEETSGYESPEQKTIRLAKQERARKTLLERFMVKDEEDEAEDS